jgi:hypothetical protein
MRLKSLSLQKQRSRTFTTLISLLVVADFLLPVRFAGNDGFDPAVLKEFAERVAVAAFVRKKLRDARDQAHAWLRHDAVIGVARRLGRVPRDGTDHRLPHESWYFFLPPLVFPIACAAGPLFASGTSMDFD